MGKIASCSARSASPGRGWPRKLAALVGWQCWLPWLWAGLLTCLFWMLMSRRCPISPPASRPVVVSRLGASLTVLLIWLLVTDDLAGLSGIFHYFSRFIFNVAWQGLWKQPWPWIVSLIAAAALCYLAGWLSGRGEDKRTIGGINVALAAFFLLQIVFLILWVRGLGLESPLTSEDNGSFIYGHFVSEKARLLTVNYNPFWNAGAVEWEPLRSATPALYILARPFVWFLPLIKAYTFFTPLIFAFILPWFVFFGLRWGGVGRNGVLFGAILSLMPSTNWAYWMAGGASGGILSAGLSLPALILFWRLLEDPSPSWRHLLLLVGFFSLALMWQPFVFAAGVPAVTILLVHWRGMNPKRLFKVGAVIALLAGFNAIWFTSFMRYFPIRSFTSQAVRPGAQFSPSLCLQKALVLVGEINPLILVLGVAGLAVLRTSRRRDLIIFLAWILLATTCLSEFLPDFQLFRLHQYIATLLILPAALYWDNLWAAGPKRRALRALWAGLLPLLVLQIIASGLFYGLKVNNREPTVAPPNSLSLAGWLGREGGPAGRVLFVGRTEKQYHGSAAYLQMLSSRPMIADFYIWNIQRGLEVNLPANLCLTPPSPKDFHRLLEIYNVGQLVNHLGQKNWALFLSSLPYLKLTQVIDGRFAVYETGIESNLFLRGQGKVVEQFNCLRVYPAGKDRLVLKYHYVEGLSVNKGIRLSRVRVWPGVDFIGVDGHRGQTFDITF